MAHITNHTLNRIVSEIDLNKEPYPKKSRLENKDLNLLSKKECQRLASITEIIGSKFINEGRFFLKIKKPTDSYSRVFPEKAPSYHIDPHCKALSSEYENYTIPTEIRMQGENSVIEYRIFFVKNISLYKKDPITFIQNTRIKFNLKLPLNTSDIVEERNPNSGKNSVKNLNLETAEKELDEAIEKAYSYKNKNPKIRGTINFYGNIFKYKCEDKEIMKIINEWNDLKKIIKQKYIIFTTIKNNLELNIESNFLDSIGLQKCSLCYKEKEGDIDIKAALS